MVSESQETIHLKISQTDRRIDWHFGCCQKVNIFMVKTDMMRHFLTMYIPYIVHHVIRRCPLASTNSSTTWAVS